MDNKKQKNMAPTVVLASHGNKKAIRELYINYYKTIFFICSCLTKNVDASLKCTVLAFGKMFEALPNLDNHNDFEPWFFAITINICKAHISAKNGNIADAELLSLASSANVFAKNGDTQSLEKTMTELIEKSVTSLPSEARVIYFYKNMALFGAEEIAALQKITREEAQNRLDALEILTSRQQEKIKEFGVDITPFFADTKQTLEHIAAKKYVPASVHYDVSQLTEVNVDPLCKEKSPEPQKKEDQKKQTKKMPAKPKAKFNMRNFAVLLLIIAFVLTVCVITGSFFGKNNAEQPPIGSQSSEKPALLWNGAAAADFDGGSGTKEDPYQIATGGQLAYLANLVNGGNSLYAASHYILTADIILNETDDFSSWSTNPPENKWTPIGGKSDENSVYFTGTFDGADHTLSGMYVNTAEDYAGLFGICRNSQIKNITLKNCYVNAGSYAGGIAGYFSADATKNSGFEYCGFAGTVKSSGNNAGGITGYFRADGENNITQITCCFSSGTVTAQKAYSGGITGANEADTGSSFIKNCYSNAHIYAAKNAGGIAGDCRSANGIASAEYCYSAGKITATENAGGISGFANCVEGTGKVHIQDCYMLSTACDVGTTKGDGAEKLVVNDIYVLTDEEMQNTQNFKNYNFDEIWMMSKDDSYKYPILQGTTFALNKPVKEESLT